MMLRIYELRVLLGREFVRKRPSYAGARIDGRLAANLKVKYYVTLADVRDWIQDS